MKQYLSLALAALMLISTLLLTACDTAGSTTGADGDTTAADTTAADATAAETTGTETESETETTPPTPAEALAAAETALADIPYSLTLSAQYECDDKELNEAFKTMSMEIPTTIYGKDMSSSIDMDIGGIAMKSEVAVIGNVLYQNIEVNGEATKNKCTMTDEQYKEYMEETNSALPIDHTSFGDLKIELKDNKQIVTASGITEAGKKILNEEVASALEGMGTSVKLGDVSYIATLKDGKLESIAMTCSYTMDIEGKTYSITIKMNGTYQYDNVQKPAAPADADTYEEIAYSDLMG